MRDDDTEVRIAREPPASATAAALAARYYAELESRFPGGMSLDARFSADADELEPPSGALLVVWQGENAVGCGGVRRLGDALGEIKRMWVDPVMRGRGVGRALLGALEAAALEASYVRVRLDTSTHLREAIALYRSAGYREIPAYNENIYAGLWLEKSLVGTVTA